MRLKLSDGSYYLISGSLIALAEVLLFLGYMKFAIIVHSGNLLFLALSAAFTENRSNLALMLLPLFRLLNIAMPVFFSLTLYSYSLVYAPMFFAVYLIIKSGLFSYEELGITAKGLIYYLPLGAFVGLVLGWVEYQVIHPQVLAPDLGIRGLLILLAVMVLFVGLVEEFIFRSVLQTAISDKYGKIKGVLIASIFFGLMHSGYHVPTEILFTFSAGMAFGLLFWKTGSFPLVTLAHGITNVSLFMIVPAYGGLLLPLCAAFLITFFAALIYAKGLSSLGSLISRSSTGERP